MKELEFTLPEITANGVITPRAVRKHFERLMAEGRETLEFHMSKELEDYLLQSIRDGEPRAFLERTREVMGGDDARIGNFDPDAQGQARGAFTAGIALFTRAAVDAGLQQEIAYCLSDAYLLELPALRSREQILQMIAVAGADFANRVRLSKQRYSAPVRRCCEYVHNHLHYPIMAGELPPVCGLSQRYLAALFQKELGMGPKQYILREKLSAAREALLSGDAPIAEIAALYAFSSASSFSQHYRRLFREMPSETRKARP